MLPSDDCRGWLHGIKYEDWALDLHSRLVWSLLISFDPHIFYTWYQVESLWTRGDYSGLLIDTKLDTIINRQYKPIHQTCLSHFWLLFGWFHTKIWVSVVSIVGKSVTLWNGPWLNRSSLRNGMAACLTSLTTFLWWNGPYQAWFRSMYNLNPLNLPSKKFCHFQKRTVYAWEEGLAHQFSSGSSAMQQRGWKENLLGRKNFTTMNWIDLKVLR